MDMGGAYETSPPYMRDDCEHHQFKNSNKCSLYGGTMPLRAWTANAKQKVVGLNLSVKIVFFVLCESISNEYYCCS